jgi:hypothetical protein
MKLLIKQFSQDPVTPSILRTNIVLKHSIYILRLGGEIRLHIHTKQKKNLEIFIVKPLCLCIGTGKESGSEMTGSKHSPKSLKYFNSVIF